MNNLRVTDPYERMKALERDEILYLKQKFSEFASDILAEELASSLSPNFAVWHDAAARREYHRRHSSSTFTSDSFVEHMRERTYSRIAGELGANLIKEAEIIELTQQPQELHQDFPLIA